MTDIETVPNPFGNLPERRYQFRPHQRIKRGLDFQRTFRHRCSIADSRLIVYGCSNGLAYSRLGLSISKKLGSAVQRNRHKRALREAFRLEQHTLPIGFDFVVIPRPGMAISTPKCRASLRQLCQRLVRRCQRKIGKDGTTYS